MTVAVKIDELQQFSKGLKSLPNNVARAILGRALEAGSKQLVEAAKKEVPVDTGHLRDSIDYKMQRINALDYQSTVSPFHTKGKNKNNPFYAHMVEFGGRYIVKARGLDKGKKKGRVIATGRVPAQPFMRPAFDAEKKEIIQTIADQVGSMVARQFKKLGKHRRG